MKYNDVSEKKKIIRTKIDLQFFIHIRLRSSGNTGLYPPIKSVAGVNALLVGVTRRIVTLAAVSGHTNPVGTVRTRMADVVSGEM